jgi:glutathione S-transferase
MWLTNTLQATLVVYFYPERWVNAGNAAGAAEVRHHAEIRINNLLKQLDNELTRHGGPWFMGQTYTALDAYVFTLCRWTRNFAGAPARSKRQLGPYLLRMLERPAVQRVLTNEGLSPPFI